MNNTYLVFDVFCSAAVGVGFYGNEDAHKGVSQFAKAGTDADNTIHTMKTQVSNPYKKHEQCSCPGQQYTATCTCVRLLMTSLFVSVRVLISYKLKFHGINEHFLNQTDNPVHELQAYRWKLPTVFYHSLAPTV